MKQIVVTAPDADHAALKAHAALAFRTIGQHTLALALQSMKASNVEPLQPHTAVANMLRRRNKKPR